MRSTTIKLPENTDDRIKAIVAKAKAEGRRWPNNQSSVIVEAIDRLWIAEGRPQPPTQQETGL